MTPPPELERPFALARLAGEVSVDVRADPDELVRIAGRLRIEAVSRLEVRFSLHRLAAGVIEADGALAALVTQQCVVTLEPFEQPVEERFTVRFVPDEPDDESIDPDSIDEIPYQGDRIDLGEAAIEQLALALDPFPRKPGAALSAEVTAESGDDTVAATIHPFARLRARRDPT